MRVHSRPLVPVRLFFELLLGIGHQGPKGYPPTRVVGTSPDQGGMSPSIALRGAGKLVACARNTGKRRSGGFAEKTAQ